MFVDTFSNRLNDAMKFKNMKQVDLIKRTRDVMQELIPNYEGDGIDKTLLSKYINGVAKAKQDNIFILAKALDVSEVWLMGMDAPMERASEQLLNDNISEELQRKISRLNDEQKKIILNVIDNMK